MPARCLQGVETVAADALPDRPLSSFLDLIMGDLPVIPLRFSQNTFVYSTNVQNVTMDLYGYVNLTEITTSAG